VATAQLHAPLARDTVPGYAGEGPGGEGGDRANPSFKTT
jgi:hypothetical protein